MSLPLRTWALGLILAGGLLSGVACAANDGQKDFVTANAHANDRIEEFEATSYKQANGLFRNVNGRFENVGAGAGPDFEVARAATQQAQESLRINQNRYDSGLANITDLLRVEEASRRAQADYWEAVYRYRTSYARLELATGSLSANSAVVTQ